MIPMAPGQTIGSVLEDDAELSTFNNLIRHSGLIEQLDGPGTFTVFAPTNDAFEKLPPGTMGALMRDDERIRRLMSHHVVPGLYAAEGLAEESQLHPLSGDTLFVVAADEGIVIGSAGLEDTDIPAANGVVHTIDSVMFPE